MDVVKNPLGPQNYPSGQVPGYDVFDSPEGDRYVISTRIGQSDPGVATTGTTEVAEVPVRQMTAGERADLDAEKIALHGALRVREYDSAPVLGAVLQSRVTNDPQASSNVIIFLEEPVDPDIEWVIQREIAIGDLSTAKDVVTRRAELNDLRRAKVADAVANARPVVERHGGTVIPLCENLYCLAAVVPNSSLPGLAQSSRIRRITASQTLHTNHNTSPTGIPMYKGTQLTQFLEPTSPWTTFDGENRTSNRGYDNILIAAIDQTGFDLDHPGFYDDSGPSGSRLTPHTCYMVFWPTVYWTCAQSSTEPSGSHGTEVLGYAIGDLRDGQDGMTTTERKKRSGYAGEADALTYDVTPAVNSAIAAMDHIAGLSTKPSMVLSALGNDTNDTSCLGQTAQSLAWNDIYENGMLPIFAAGNIEGSSTNCTVDEPGSAIGSFSVGAHGTFDYDHGTEYDVRYATIWDEPSSLGSAYGGNSSEGDNRSIIELTTYGCRQFGFDASGGYGQNTCGTSNSAAVLAAANIDFVDYYINESWTTDIRTLPGWQTAAMLLFGDRRLASLQLLSRFHSLYGGGRLKARRFDGPFMDSPWKVGLGEVCVGDNETVTLSVNGGNTISSDVEAMKAVIWWYDRRHEDGTDIDDIDLKLYTTGGSYLRGSTDAYDEKERIFYDVGGYAVELRLYGYDVTADYAGCGFNKMKVYYAWFYEDSDRDDSDGPSGSEIEPE